MRHHSLRRHILFNPELRCRHRHGRLCRHPIGAARCRRLLRRLGELEGVLREGEVREVGEGVL
jgi:hypothetical protein